MKKPLHLATILLYDDLQFFVNYETAPIL